MQSVKKDERMFFMWTKEELAEAKKHGSSCEDMVSYKERLRAWKSLIVVSGSPYRIDTTAFADQVPASPITQSGLRTEDT
jgi:hypothetical protein